MKLQTICHYFPDPYFQYAEMSTNHLLFNTTHLFHCGIVLHCMSITEHTYLFCCY